MKETIEKYLKELNRGLTLIEIIISVAILGIIVVAFLSSFSSGYITVIRARDRSEDLFETQEHIESNLSTGSISDSQTFKMVFNGTEIETKGQIINEVSDEGVDIKIFIPENSILLDNN